MFKIWVFWRHVKAQFSSKSIRTFRQVTASEVIKAQSLLVPLRIEKRKIISALTEVQTRILLPKRTRNSKHEACARDKYAGMMRSCA